MKKKLQTRYGVIETPKSHVLNSHDTGFAVSPYMTEKICFVGQATVFETGSELISSLCHQDVNAKKIERISHSYGSKIEPLLNDPEKEVDANSTPSYVMVDGSMVFTREEKWKEIKLCRMFNEHDNITISKNRNEITSSRYVAHLGNHKEFLEKVECHVDKKLNKVFIADGAKWIWNWVSDSYPEAIQILDFFHAKEYLCHFADQYVTDKIKRSQWVQTNSHHLLEDQVDKVISEMKTLQTKHPTSNQKGQNCIGYFENNAQRMKYKTYREKGYLIGSGAMEAAHRHVIQERLKLSGQRWTSLGLQQIANLRVAQKSGLWKLITESMESNT